MCTFNLLTFSTLLGLLGILLWLLLLIVLVAIADLAAVIVVIAITLIILLLHRVTNVGDLELFDNIITLLVFGALLRWRYHLLGHFRLLFFDRLAGILAFGASSAILSSLVIGHLSPVLLVGALGTTFLLLLIFLFFVHICLEIFGKLKFINYFEKVCFELDFFNHMFNSKILKKYICIFLKE